MLVDFLKLCLPLWLPLPGSPVIRGTAHRGKNTWNKEGGVDYFQQILSLLHGLSLPRVPEVRWVMSPQEDGRGVGTGQEE